MKARKVMIKARLYLGDMGKAVASDWEVYEAINDALRIYAEISAKAKGKLFRNRVTLNMVDGVALLPETFISVGRVRSGLRLQTSDEGPELLEVFQSAPLVGEYAIVGTHIYSGDASIVLEYSGYPDDVLNEASDIDLPLSYLVALAQVTSLILKGETIGAMVFADNFLSGNIPSGTAEEVTE